MSKNLPNQKKVVSVWLEPSKNDQLLMFWCFNCRTPVLQYRGEVSQIIPGNTPYTPHTQIECKGSFKNENNEWQKCGQFFVFMGTITTENPEQV